MPQLTATFAAETSRFQREIQNARASVTGFERETKRVGTTLNRFADEFSGARVIRDAEAMARAVQQIGGVTRLTTAEQQRLSAAVNEGIAKYRALGQEVPQHLQRVQGELAATQQQTAGFGEHFRNLFVIDIAKGVELATQAVKATIDAFGDLIDRGSEIASIRRPFETLTGGAFLAEQQLEGMREATLGLVDDLTLMTQANRAAILGLTKMGVETDELSRVATVLGRAMGLDAADAVDKLTIALGRGSVLRLDDLGIVLSLDEAYEEYAARIETTAAQLTDQEKTQAFATIAMERAREKANELGDVQLTLGDRIQQSRIGATRFYDTLAEGIVTNEKVIGLFDQLGESARRLFSGDTTDQANRFAEVIGNIAENLTPVIQRIEKAIARGQRLGEIITQIPGVGMFGATVRGLTEAPAVPPPAPAIFAPREAPAPVPRVGGIPTPPKPPKPKALTDLEQFQKQVQDLQEDLQRGLLGGQITLDEAFTKWGAAAVKAADDARFLGLEVQTLPPLIRSFGDEFERAQALEIIRQGMPRFLADVRNIKVELAQMPAPFGDMSEALRSLTPRLDVTARSVKGIQQQLEPLPRSIDLITRAETEAQQGAERFRGGISDLSQSFAQMAQISGPAFGGVIQDVAGLVGAMDAGIKTAESFAAALEQALGVQVGAKGQAGIAGATTGLAVSSAVGGVGGVAAGIGAGALAGFTVGGPWGAVIGGAAAAGTSLLQFASATAAATRQMREQRELFISQFRSIEDLQRQARSAGVPSAQIEAFLTTSSPETFEQVSTSITAALERQEREAEALAESLQRVSAVNGVISQQQAEQVRQALVLSSAQLNLPPRRAGTAEALGQAQPRGPTDIGALREGPQREIVEQFLQQQASATAGGLERLLTGAQSITQQQATAVSSALGSMFTELQRGGASTTDVLRSLEPQIERFEELLRGTGQSGGAAFERLNRQLGVLQDERLGGLVESAIGAGQTMAGLQNQFLLTTEEALGLSSVISNTHRELTLAGHGGRDALVLLQAPLQQAWQLAEDFEVKLDAATQQLVRQAEAAGLVGDQFRPVEERMTSAIETLVDRLDAFLDLFASDTRETGEQAASDLTQTFANLEIPPVRVPIEYDDPRGNATSPATSSRASRKRNEATLTSSSKATPVVVEVTSSNTLNLDGRVAAKSVVRHAPEVLAGLGL